MMVLMMGVSGSGKSSVGVALAAALGVAFLEGDSLHPPDNIAKMAAGVPLDDADRAPWLDAIAAWMAGRADGVVACSALKRAYRDHLRTAAPNLRIVALLPPPGVLAERLGHRLGHFMPGSLLASQLATLEAPAEDEAALTITNDGSVQAVATTVLRMLDEPYGAPSINA